jgi:hypothetical protein
LTGFDVIATEHAESWFATVYASSNAVLKELEAARDTKDLITVGSFPLRAIRELKVNDEDIYLGDIGLQRCVNGRLLTMSAGVQESDEEKARLAKENLDRSLGDPEIIWTIGGMLTQQATGFAC